MYKENKSKDLIENVMDFDILKINDQTLYNGTITKKIDLILELYKRDILALEKLCRQSRQNKFVLMI